MNQEKVIKKIDRIVLDPEAMKIVKDIIHQVQTELGDLILVNAKIIGNFLIKKHSEILSKDELEQLKNENHDIIKALRKATVEAIKARQNGSEMQYNDVLKILQKSIETPQKPRIKKKKENDSEPIKENNYLEQNK